MVSKSGKVWLILLCNDDVTWMCFGQKFKPWPGLGQTMSRWHHYITKSTRPSCFFLKLFWNNYIHNVCVWAGKSGYEPTHKCTLITAKYDFSSGEKSYNEGSGFTKLGFVHTSILLQSGTPTLIAIAGSMATPVAFVYYLLSTVHHQKGIGMQLTYIIRTHLSTYSHQLNI